MIDPLALPLRDIHLPPEPGWWPPAPGWWMLAVLGVAAVSGVAWWVRQRRRTRARRAALAVLRRLEHGWREGGDPRELAAGLSALLRRTAMSIAPRERVAGLTGARWIGQLAALSRNELDASAISTLLAAAHAPRSEGDAEIWLSACRRWLEGLRMEGSA